MTDKGGQYFHVGKEFARHETVNHGTDEYVRGDVYTNNAECRFSLMKRAVFGAPIRSARPICRATLRNGIFKWNPRKMKGGERGARVLKGTEGKRLIVRNVAYIAPDPIRPIVASSAAASAPASFQ
jgi:hypothetical protein